MAVYLDDYRVLWRGREWSHLIADTTEELHAFAARLGRSELRFHHKPARPWKDHYDVPEAKRRDAIGLGAKSITSREAAQMLRARRLGRGGPTGVEAATIGTMHGSAGTGGAPADPGGGKLARLAPTDTAREELTRLAPSDPAREELARQAARSWTDAQSLLFVCLGNVCRSPFAERLALNRCQGRRRATSAGHYQSSGRRPPELALAAAQAFGVDLASHRSRVLSRTMLEKADAVFVFDHENYDAVISLHPGATEHTHLLGALSHEGPVVIADPFGGAPSTYDAVYRQIADAIAAGEQARE